MPANYPQMGYVDSSGMGRLLGGWSQVCWEEAASQSRPAGM